MNNEEEDKMSLMPSPDRRLKALSSDLVTRGLSDLINLKSTGANPQLRFFDERTSEQTKPDFIDTIVHSSTPFDEETYREIKPHLIVATNHFYKPGMSLADLVRALADWMRTTYDLTIEELRAFKGYLVRFVEDTRDGKIEIEEVRAVNAAADEVAPSSLNDRLESAKVQVSYWMPEEFNSLLTGDRFAPQVVGVVKGKRGQRLDRETYLELLQNRLKELFQQEDHPEWALAELLAQLDQQALGPSGNYDDPLTVENAPQRILQSGDLLQYLDQIGVPGELPKTFPANNEEAETLYQDKSLNDWWEHLLSKPYNPDR